jgi:hypothetical protein
MRKNMLDYRGRAVYSSKRRGKEGRRLSEPGFVFDSVRGWAIISLLTKHFFKMEE